MLQCKYTILILSENIGKMCEGLTNNIWLVFFFEIYPRSVWQNSFLFKNNVVKINLKVCLPNNPLIQKPLQKNISK